MDPLVSDTFFYALKFYGLCFLFAVLLYNVARLAEKNAYDAGIHEGKRRYTANPDRIVFRKPADAEKVERDNG